MKQTWKSLLKIFGKLIQIVTEYRWKQLLHKGHEQIHLGLYQAALKSIKKAQKLNPSNPEVLYALGSISYVSDNYEASLIYRRFKSEVQHLEVFS
jgi:tetratricopeptide (TPR) repeat protein